MTLSRRLDRLEQARKPARQDFAVWFPGEPEPPEGWEGAACQVDFPDHPEATR